MPHRWRADGTPAGRVRQGEEIQNELSHAERPDLGILFRARWPMGDGPNSAADLYQNHVHPENLAADPTSDLTFRLADADYTRSANAKMMTRARTQPLWIHIRLTNALGAHGGTGPRRNEHWDTSSLRPGSLGHSSGRRSLQPLQMGQMEMNRRRSKANDAHRPS